LSLKKVVPLLGAGALLFAFFLGIGPILSLLPEPIAPNASLLRDGAIATVKLTALSGFFGFFIGLALALLQRADNRVLRLISNAVVSTVRGTPLLVQILFCYFALPTLLPFMALNEFSAAAFALALNTGAYNSEVFRAGLNSVHKGQLEASRSLGLGRIQSFVFVLFPQALRFSMPPLMNNLISLLKDSSLASSIGMLELALAGSRISSESFKPVPVLTTVAVLYFALTSIMTLCAHWYERTQK
jgi:polar amino acid transport system permease protein